jgi:hypothetical protein
MSVIADSTSNSRSSSVGPSLSTSPKQLHRNQIHLPQPSTILDDIDWKTSTAPPQDVATFVTDTASSPIVLIDACVDPGFDCTYRYPSQTRTPARYHTLGPQQSQKPIINRNDAKYRHSLDPRNTPFVNYDNDYDDSSSEEETRNVLVDSSDDDSDDLDELQILDRLLVAKRQKAQKEAEMFFSGGATMNHATVQQILRMMQNNPSLGMANSSTTQELMKDMMHNNPNVPASLTSSKIHR